MVEQTMPQIIDTRQTLLNLGTDFSADAKVLAINGFIRLVWQKGHKTCLGMRGMGATTFHTSLQIRFFKDTPNHYLKSIDLCAGGKLSPKRILEFSEIIDIHFGKGAAKKIASDIKSTHFFGEDLLEPLIKNIKKEQDKMFEERAKSNPLKEAAMRCNSIFNVKI